MALKVDIKTITDAGFDNYLSNTSYGVFEGGIGGSITKTKADYLVGGTIGSEGNVSVNTDRFVLDGREQRISIKDAVPRVMIGKRPDGTFGFDISETDVDVFAASLDELIVSDRIVRVSYKWSTFVESTNEEGSGGESVGVVSYMDTAATNHNKVVRLDFNIASDLTIETAIIETKYLDSYLGGVGYKRNNDVSIYLNPTKTNTRGTNGPRFYFWRFSTGSGAQIRNVYDPTGDEDTTTDTLSAAQIAKIASGWNEIVVQQDTNDASEDKLGYAAVDFTITGYITL